LICFPYAGGSASIFSGWRDYLADDIELLCAELPGRGERILEPPFTNFFALIDELRFELRPLLDLPMAFFGHSMGGLLAFELANELRRQRLPQPVHVFVSAYRAPQLRTIDRPIHRLPKAAFLSELRRRYGAAGHLLKHPELLEVFLPLLRADLAVCESYWYRPRPPLRCPLTALGGAADGGVNRRQLSAWRLHTRDRFTLRIFPGDHFFLHQARRPLIGLINRQLRWVLGPVQSLARTWSLDDTD
jgi:medium-chain acyl-[acyl-carrier-protein] hydrolase